jgi:hypothetical protein
MYAKFIPIFAVESFVLFPFTADYLNLEMFKIFYLLGVLRKCLFSPSSFCKERMPLSNSTVIFLPDVSDVWRWPNPVKTLNAHFLLQVKEKNTKINKITIVKNQKLATQNFLFKMHINVPFGNI